MIPENWTGIAVFLLLGLCFRRSVLAAAAYIGVNIGTFVSDMPSSAFEVVVALLKAHQITHVGLCDADAHMLSALSDSGIEVIVGVTNEEILAIGQSPANAAAWVSNNVAAYLPSTNITAIAVGSEVLTQVVHVAPVLVPAMINIHRALVVSNLNFQVKVSTPQSMDVISRQFPPSTATFNPFWNSTVHQVLQFLKNTNSFYKLNAYPYYGYVKTHGIFPIEYALLKPMPFVDQIVDPNTLLHYNSMFDAMVDAIYYSIEALNFSAIPIVVTESGWPWLDGAKESDATLENAETYTNNLIRRVLNNLGPPCQPNIPINTYIYKLFNDDKMLGPLSEKNWDSSSTNENTVYPFRLSTSSCLTENSSAIFCEAKQDADIDNLRDRLNWTCRQDQANCRAIQPGQPCYKPNNILNHASYVYNGCYQKMRSVFDFNGTATITSVDPTFGPAIPLEEGGSTLAVSKLKIQISVSSILLALALILR